MSENHVVAEAWMHILALKQGHYGERIVDNIMASAPSGWSIEAISAPKTLPIIVDDPEEFLPAKVPASELLLALSESPETAQLIPAIAKRAKVKAVIMPVDNSAWLPLGLKDQLKQELGGMGIKAVFPKTFCTLTETSAGYGDDMERFSDDCIATFATLFGWPRLRIEVDAQARITKVGVERSAPCGSTLRVAEKLLGVPLSEAVPQAGLHAHHYPCLASMDLEPFGETLMHVGGYVVNDEVKREMKRLQQSGY